MNANAPQKQADDEAALERAQLLECLKGARSAIAQLRPAELRVVGLPSALSQMSAIVESTESAANEIMSAAEEILAAANAPGDRVDDSLRAACMRIFEACSFQDLTGQRIQKVVLTLLNIEDKLAALEQSLIGDEVLSDETPNIDDELSGPSLPGEAVSQDEIDRLMR